VGNKQKLLVVGFGAFGGLGSLTFGDFFGGSSALFFGSLASGGAGFELVNAAFDVDNALFASKEGMRATGDVHFDQWIFNAIKRDGFFGVDRGARQKRRAIVEILENDGSIIVRVQILFHINMQVYTSVSQQSTIQRLCLRFSAKRTKMMNMPERLRFGLDRTDRNWRLWLRVPSSVLGRAQDIDKKFAARVEALSSDRVLRIEDMLPRGVRGVGVNARAIGRKAAPSKKETLVEVNRLLGLLITNVPDEEVDPALDVTAFWPDYSDEGYFSLKADVSLPNRIPHFAGEVAAQQMRVMAHNLRPLPPQYVIELKGDKVAATVDRANGIELNFGSVSVVQTWHNRLVGSTRIAEVAGERVEPLAEPLIYLAGLVAIAHADELA
jgi:hypothetical protein